MREETHSFQLAARVPLYTLFHKQDHVYHGVCNTSTGWNENLVMGKQIFYLMTNSTDFIYDYVVSDILLSNNCCRYFMG